MAIENNLKCRPRIIEGNDDIKEFVAAHHYNIFFESEAVNFGSFAQQKSQKSRREKTCREFIKKHWKSCIQLLQSQWYLRMQNDEDFSKMREPCYELKVHHLASVYAQDSDFFEYVANWYSREVQVCTLNKKYRQPVFVAARRHTTTTILFSHFQDNYITHLRITRCFYYKITTDFRTPGGNT